MELEDLGQRKRRTLQDVADAVGVSANTVSRALSGKPGVREKTRELVKQQAEQLGYVPNVHARSLVLGSRKAIGLVITNMSNPFYAQLVSEIELHAAEAGYTITLFLSDESPERERTAVGSVIQTGLDGVIAVPVQGPDNPWENVQRAGTPLVLVNRMLSSLDVDFVATDSKAATHMATSHVIDRGAKSVILLEEDLMISTVAQRIEGFRDAMADRGLAVDEHDVVAVPTRRNHRAALPWQAHDAYQVARDLLARGHRPDAFVVGNDYFALGVYRALREQRLSIPDDVLVVGFGDHPFSEFLTPSLSTVRLPATEVGSTAIAMLLRQLDGSAQGAKSILVRPELVIRDSTLR